MNKRIRSVMMWALLLVGILTLAFGLRTVQASPETVLYLDPSSFVDASLTPGNSFMVDIMVSDVEYLYAWQVNMSFDPSVLEFVNVTEGDFLESQPEGTFGAKRIESVEGWGIFGWTTVGMFVGVSGSGTLATIEFRVLAEGESILEFEVLTRLYGLDTSLPPPNFYHIPFAAEDGYFNNSAPPSVYELIDAIENWHLQRGTERSLVAKLKAAGHMLDIGQGDGAIQKLTVFTDRVQKLRDKTLTNEQADYLLSEAQRIIELIEG